MTSKIDSDSTEQVTEARSSREAENPVQIGAVADVTSTTTNIQRSESIAEKQIGSSHIRIRKTPKINPVTATKTHDEIPFG